ncbi:MAG: NAD(P)/FAD-dependent oxidoreductase [Bacteroidia bacterium]|nr:NAD(P)/FAD-dependent oxidoreductase [Bacteroidia bacterium]
MLMQQYDVIILGAGPAGCATAISLCKKGFKTIILDKKSVSAQPVGENLDVTAKTILSELNLDVRSLDAAHMAAYHSVSLWANKTPVWKDSLFNPNGHGWHLNRAEFDNCLLNTAMQTGVEYLTCEQLEIETDIDQWKINFNVKAEQRSLNCRFLVDCTGRARVLSRKLSVPLFRFDSLMSITSSFECEGNEIATQSIIEAAPNGWWYSACVPGNKRVLSFFTNAKTDYFKMYADANKFYEGIGETTLLKEIVPAKELFSELTFRYANSEKPEKICGSNWISAGDAAAAFDPLSSQGISTALKMGVKAAGAVAVKLSTDSDSALAAYEKTYNDLFDDYLDQRQKYYASVFAWDTNDFWKTNSSINIKSLHN